MEYFAGLDVSMEETHVCVVDRDGGVIHQARVPSTAADLDEELAKAPACRRVVFETGRMAPMLYHGLLARGLPVVCVESRQAYQALKSLATHKTDRNDARGLAHLARTGFFKPVHVKSLPAHAVRSLIIARKKLVGQRVTLENQIRGLAVMFGVRLPRALSPAFIDQALRSSEGIDGLSAGDAGPHCRASCRARSRPGDRYRHQEDGQSVRCLPSIDDDPRRRPAHRTCLHGRR
jgi:transposase